MATGNTVRLAAFQLIVLLLFLDNTLINGETCVKSSLCSCESSDGKWKVDLNEFQQPVTDATPNGQVVIIWYLCQVSDMVSCCNHDTDPKLCPVTIKCQNKVAYVLDTSANNHSTYYYPVGDPHSVEFVGRSSANAIDMPISISMSSTAEDGIKRTLQIDLLCLPETPIKQTDPQFRVQDKVGVNSYRAQFYSAKFCRPPTAHSTMHFSVNCQQSDSSSVSAGTIICIVFLIAVVSYMVAGTIYARAVQQKRGRQAIPNVEFWCELPLLIRDGCRFLAGGCTVAHIYQKL